MFKNQRFLGKNGTYKKYLKYIRGFLKAIIFESLTKESSLDHDN